MQVYGDIKQQRGNNLNDRDKYDSLPVTGYSPGKSQILIIINSYKPREMSGLLNTACHSQELM